MYGNWTRDYLTHVSTVYESLNCVTVELKEINMFVFHFFSQMSEEILLADYSRHVKIVVLSSDSKTSQILVLISSIKFSLPRVLVFDDCAKTIAIVSK